MLSINPIFANYRVTGTIVPFHCRRSSCQNGQIGAPHQCPGGNDSTDVDVRCTSGREPIEKQTTLHLHYIFVQLIQIVKQRPLLWRNILTRFILFIEWTTHEGLHAVADPIRMVSPAWGKWVNWLAPGHILEDSYVGFKNSFTTLFRLAEKSCILASETYLMVKC